MIRPQALSSISVVRGTDAPWLSISEAHPVLSTGARDSAGPRENFADDLVFRQTASLNRRGSVIATRSIHPASGGGRPEIEMVGVRCVNRYFEVPGDRDGLRVVPKSPVGSGGRCRGCAARIGGC